MADQQVWGIETQTRAAGGDDEDVAKAGLIGRLLIDWQLSEPIYQGPRRIDRGCPRRRSLDRLR